jgi:hypothetical protein
MNDCTHTDAELAYWIEKYLLFCRTRSFTSLVMAGGGGSSQIMTTVASQDLIGWTEFIHGKISIDKEAIQQVHCALSPCQITGQDRVKLFLSHLKLRILHCRINGTGIYN